MISLIYGGITHHYLASNLPYCNRINNVGTIHNEYIIALAGNNKAKFGFLNGKDSACGNIFGPISSFNVRKNIDIMVGGYNTNFNEFNKLGIIPVHVGNITPIIGANFKIPITKNIEINNLISIGIITHAISVSF